MATNPALDLLHALAAAQDYATAASIMRATSIPLDADFYEKLWWQIGQWRAKGDPFADWAQRAFDYLWEFRYRRTNIDHWVTAEAQAFVEAILAQPNVEQMRRFALANQERLSPNLVAAFYAAKFVADTSDRAKTECLMSIAAGAAEALGMQLQHQPPILYREIITDILFEAYRVRKMQDVLSKIPIALPLGFTIAAMLDDLQAEEMLGEDERITTFVNFVEAVAMHLSERPVAEGDQAHDVAIYLYERLVPLYVDQGLAEEYARTLANVEDTRVKKGY
jgi:hypothetical protein